MDPLLMSLENSHILSRNVGDIPVRNYNSPASGFKHAAYLFQRVSIQVVHSVCFFDTDRLAVRKIRHHCIDGSTGKRKTRGISKQEV